MKKYESYTICPSLWNKEFPSHWCVLPMYAVAKEKSICNCVDLPLLSVYLDVGVVPFSAKAEKRTNVTSKDLSKYQRVDFGDFVLNNQQAWRGSVGISFDTGIVSPAYVVLSMNDYLDSRYANYLFRSRIMVEQYLINSKSVGSIQRNIYWPALKRTKVLIPFRDEQDQIVRFLDWKVSSINRLINIKKKEIKDIDALKRSLISHAITHGLSADAPMKYSGVKWLGNIPAHWRIMKLRQILHPVSEKNHPELPLLSVVREHGVILRDIEDTESNHNYIPDDLSGYKVVKKGQFAMNKMKAWQGSYGISDYTGIVSPAYFIFDMAFENLEYFHYAIRSKVYVNFFAQASDGIRVGQWDLQMDKMKEIPFIIPPSDEQNAIVEHIKNTLPTYNNAIEKLTAEVEVLEEYKAKIIADTVTGKIDVRGIEIPEYEFVEETIDGDSEGCEEETEEQED
ncbi:restriction endonuclease subunit S [Dialister sp. i34-0019-2H8]|uniref:restriction endonuclease subunit S n=1 Tax=Dialister sp. i34-0019-2H8 TaxID=3141190 RepID=UPI0034C312E9